MVTLYGCKRTRSTRALWALEEAGLAYTYVHVDLAAGEGRREPFVAINPAAKVPVLVDGTTVISESAAICTYIGDLCPDALWVPRAVTKERGLYNRWMFFVIGELEQGLWTKAKHRFAIPERYRVPEVIKTAEWEFKIASRALSQELQGRSFLVGDRFTFADLITAHTLDWARLAKLEFEDPRLHEYTDRILERPALARAREREKLASLNPDQPVVLPARS
jgi:glutathione S-transferase